MDRIIIAFGRFNPISAGHVKLARKMNEVGSEMGITPHLYLSHSYDGAYSNKPAKDDNYRNPLSYDSKLKYCEDAFGDLVKIVKSKAKNLYEILPIYYKKGVKECYIFCGSDRVNDWDSLKRYNGSNLPEAKFFNFDVFDVITAGNRNNKSRNIEEQASATLLRKCVKELDYEKFEKFAGTKTLTEEMFDELCAEMEIEIDESI